MKRIKKRVVILGAGPAGMAAAVEAENNRMDFLILDNQEPGWFAKYSINQHYTIDGYLGAYDMSGNELVKLFHKHLETKRITVLKENVKCVLKQGDCFSVICESIIILCEFLVLATGSIPKKLDIENFDKLFGKYIFHFVCKEQLNLNGKNVVVLGGRNSGATTAIYLSRETTANVLLIEKDKKLNATSKYVERLIANHVSYMVDTNIFRINACGDVLKSICVRTNDGSIKTIPADYIFCCIGMEPNYKYLKVEVEKDYANRIIVNPKTMEATKNLYAIGDINDLNPKQVSNATANGKTAIYYINKSY